MSIPTPPLRHICAFCENHRIGSDLDWCPNCGLRRIKALERHIDELESVARSCQRRISSYRASLLEIGTAIEHIGHCNNSIYPEHKHCAQNKMQAEFARITAALFPWSGDAPAVDRGSPAPQTENECLSAEVESLRAQQSAFLAAFITVRRAITTSPVHSAFEELEILVEALNEDLNRRFFEPEDKLAPKSDEK